MNLLNQLPYTIVPAPLSLLGEGPVWDRQTATLFWVDILQGTIHSYDTRQELHKKIELHEMTGAVALTTSGGLIAALKSGLKLIDRSTGVVKPFCEPEAGIPGNRFNDGKCDPAGRFWIGSMSLEEKPSEGNLYMVEKNGKYTNRVSGVSVSNGLAWSADHSIFYYIDTPTFRVMRYDYDLATGQIQNGTIAFSIPQAEGYPDGMTIDQEGMLWIAHWDGWQLARWNPHTGEKMQQIKLPVARVTSCTFGGPLLQDLYITSASVGLSESERGQQPLAGALFVFPDCGFQGMPAHSFNV